MSSGVQGVFSWVTILKQVLENMTAMCYILLDVMKALD